MLGMSVIGVGARDGVCGSDVRAGRYLSVGFNVTCNSVCGIVNAFNTAVAASSYHHRVANDCRGKKTTFLARADGSIAISSLDSCLSTLIMMVLISYFCSSNR